MKKERLFSWFLGFLLVVWAVAGGPYWGYIGVLLLINACFRLDAFSRLKSYRHRKR